MTTTETLHTDIVAAPTDETQQAPKLALVENTLKSLEDKFAKYFGANVPADLLPTGVKLHMDTSIHHNKKALHLNFLFPEPPLKFMEFDAAIKSALGKLTPIGSRLDNTKEGAESVSIISDKPANDNRHVFALELTTVKFDTVSDELHTALTNPELQQYSAPAQLPKEEAKTHACSGQGCKDCSEKAVNKDEAAKTLPQPQAIDAAAVAPVAQPQPTTATVAHNDNTATSVAADIDEAKIPPIASIATPAEAVGTLAQAPEKTRAHG